MLIRDLKRFVVLVVPLFTAIFLTIRLIKKHTHPSPYLQYQTASKAGGNHQHESPRHPPEKEPQPLPKSALQTDQQSPDKLATSSTSDDPFAAGSEDVPTTHFEISSAGISPTKKYFPIQFADRPTINPNVIPHPSRPDTWVIVAQEHPAPLAAEGKFSELVCNAAFNKRGALACMTFPIALAIAPTKTPDGNCEISGRPELAPLAMNQGPHDARVFYGGGARHPYVVYGSNSEVTCFGQWVQDFRVAAGAIASTPTATDADGTAPAMADPLAIASTVPGASPPSPPSSASNDAAAMFMNGTELRRPDGAKYNPVEKNFFLFWDVRGASYVHHDMHPRRMFSLLGPDGHAAGPDLAPQTAEADGRCMEKYLPSALQKKAEKPALVGGELEERITATDSLHQATNSLSVTLCARSDPTCAAKPDNTFVLAIVHHKAERDFRSAYEPYVVVFKQIAPFGLHAISKKPFWIRGRRSLAPLSSFNSDMVLLDDADLQSQRRTEMFYITSLSWKDSRRRYHGFLDDVLFLSFGIEDKRAAGIDVLAADLLEELGLCEGV